MSLITGLPFESFRKIGRLVLREELTFILLQFAETQASFSAIIFNLLAGLIFLITVIGFVFGVTVGADAAKMLTVSFVVFIIPHIHIVNKATVISL